MQKIGIFGGTFNPAHWGHLLMAETALSQLGLERVIWVPTYCPPHKLGMFGASFEHRREMVGLAIANHPAFTLSGIEANRQSPSYAIQTFQDLQALNPKTQWYWILGLDAFESLPRWYRRQELVPACIWLVAPRSVAVAKMGVEKNASLRSITQEQSFLFLCQQVAQQLQSQSIEIQWCPLNMPCIGISSSLIRDYCRLGRSIRHLVPDAVRIYLDSQGLYQGDRNINGSQSHFEF